MAATTTFNQIVGSETLRIAVPVTRIDKLMDRVDAMIEDGKLAKARKALEPFILTQPKGIKKGEIKVAMAAKGTNKKDAALKIITGNEGLDRAALIKKIQTDLDCTYANARYYVVTIAGK